MTATGGDAKPPQPPIPIGVAAPPAAPASTGADRDALTRDARER